MSPIILIDGSHLSYRAFHTFPTFTNNQGEPTGIAYGFFSILNSYVQKFSKDMIIAWDRKPYWRSEIYPEYKDSRNEYSEEDQQKIRYGFNKVQDICTAASILQIRKQHYEADDLITYCVKVFKENIVIISGDKDLLPLIDDSKNIKVLRPKHGVLELYDEARVLEEYKVNKDQIPLYLSICGDKSDNIKGIRGLGPVKTAKFINETNGTLEDIKSYYPSDYERIKMNVHLIDLLNTNKALDVLNMDDVVIKVQNLIGLNMLLNQLDIKAFNIRDFRDLYGNDFDRKIELTNRLTIGL